MKDNYWTLDLWQGKGMYLTVRRMPDGKYGWEIETPGDPLRAFGDEGSMVAARRAALERAVQFCENALVLAKSELAGLPGDEQ